jgi:hypothetical protein
VLQNASWKINGNARVQCAITALQYIEIPAFRMTYFPLVRIHGHLDKSPFRLPVSRKKRELPVKRLRLLDGKGRGKKPDAVYYITSERGIQRFWGSTVSSGRSAFDALETSDRM